MNLRSVSFPALISLLFFLSMGLVAADESPQAVSPQSQLSPPAADVQDLLYLGDERPVIVRLHIRIEQESFREMWARYVQQVFKDLDRDGDGLLNSAESSRLPGLTAAEQRSAGGVPAAPDQTKDAGIDATGAITLPVLESYLRRTSGGPFLTRSAASNTMAARGRAGIGGALVADPGSANLFNRLDQDVPDGKLSVGELQNASRVLRKMDLDDDETISRSELQPLFAAFGVQRGQPMNQMQSAFATPFVALNSGQPATAVVRRIIEHYRRTTSAAKLGLALGALGGLVRGGQESNGDAYSETVLKGQKLSKKQIGLSDKAFQQIDGDGDGDLDFSEMTRWLENPVPLFEVALQLGAQNRGEPSVRIIHDGSEGMIDIRTSADGWVVVAIGGVQFEIGAGNRAAFSVKQFYKMQFQAADGDKNNYLEKGETQRTPVLAAAFAAADINTDGKLYEQELDEFLDRGEAAARNRVELTISDQGRNLFEILDVNRDRRLGPLELAGAASRMLPWDADKDGCVSIGEIPRHYRLGFGRGQASFPGPIPFVAAPEVPTPQAAPLSGAGPVWFQKMDRNRDGLVSQREFLGTRAQFAKLDRDGDGSIDSAESLTAMP